MLQKTHVEEAVVERKARRQPAVNMTPMIDCVFLLIIFFMLSTTFTPLPGIRVKLPPPGRPSSDKPKGAVLRIQDPAPGAKEGIMLLSQGGVEDIVTFENTYARFMNATPEEKDMLIIQSGRSVRHDQIVHVMDLAKRAGIEKIGFAMVARE
ncbi:biopolymer transporter ExbD [Candidatus Poribacteria bacterium]|nr:biopolymer transporter ExbD [Candidatus Poribacteria bacterium]